MPKKREGGGFCLSSRSLTDDPPRCLQVQDWVEKEFGTKVDGELFCPPPWRGKTLLELGVREHLKAIHL